MLLKKRCRVFVYVLHFHVQLGIKAQCMGTSLLLSNRQNSKAGIGHLEEDGSFGNFAHIEYDHGPNARFTMLKSIGVRENYMKNGRD